MRSMESKHTPTPWRLVENNNNHCIYQGPKEKHTALIAEVSALIIDVDSDIRKTHASHDEGLANARHIVHCVNSHDALLAALKAVIAIDGNEHIKKLKKELFHNAPDIKFKIEQAIKSAEGSA